MTPVKAPATAWRIIEGEAVILTMDTKVLRGLNAVGSRVWELIDGHRDVEQIVEALAGEFSVEPARARADVQAFLRELADRGLVTLRP
jgi:hypothetical protein